MTDHDMDNLMCNILSDAIKRDYESDTEKDTPFEPSNRHQNQIRSMLKNPLNWAKKKSWPLWEHVLRRVAVAVLVITIGFGSVMAVSPTVRAAVIQWVVEWYETHIMYRYFGEDLAEEMSHYIQSYSQVLRSLDYSSVQNRNYHIRRCSTWNMSFL